MKISSKTGTYVLEIQPSHVEALLDEIGDVPSKQAGPNLQRFFRELQAHQNLRAQSRVLSQNQQGQA